MKLLLFAPVAALLLQAGFNPLQQQKATGSIEGTVTRAGTTQPVANARVTVTRRGQPAVPPGINAPVVVAGTQGSSLTPIQPVATDDRGRFVVDGLEDGAFSVQVLANGFVAQSYGQRAPNGPAAAVNVSGGQATKDINVALVPAANISGRIHDLSDRPLVNVAVQLLRYSYDGQGQRSYQTVGSTVTDDRGQYRMYWVTPGRYYLLAGKPSAGANPLEELFQAEIAGQGPNGNDVPRVLGYSFYPGVQEIANARPIEMQAGTDLQAVDITLDPKPRTYKVRGRIVDSRNGQPPPRANVAAASQMQISGADIGLIVGPDVSSPNYDARTGVFEIRDLLPGTYSIVATVMDTPVPGARGPAGRSSAMVPVTIASSDVDDITISVVPAAMVPGRVRLEGQLPGQMSVDRMRVRLTPVPGSASASLPREVASVLYQSTQTNVAGDGTFRLVNVIPGEYRIDFAGFPVGTGPNGPQYIGTMQTANAYIKEARFDGVDVLNAPLRFSGNVNSGFDVLVAFGSGRVEGSVTDVRSQPVAGGRVVVVPDRIRFRTDLYRTSSIDQSGRFTFPPLPPGDYKIFAWESVEDNAWFDPDFLARYEGRASSVHVSEGATQSVSVQIIAAEVQR